MRLYHSRFGCGLAMLVSEGIIGGEEKVLFSKRDRKSRVGWRYLEKTLPPLAKWVACMQRRCPRVE
jgi:hypothetical protein